MGVLPFRLWRRRIEVGEREARQVRDASATGRDVVWAVEKAGRYVPGVTCLVKALAAKWVLGRLGSSSVLRIGVGHNESGQFEAHAWLEQEGSIILGGSPQVDRYVPFPSPGQGR